jgi:hypothetical protein
MQESCKAFEASTTLFTIPLLHSLAKFPIAQVILLLFLISYLAFLILDPGVSLFSAISLSV